MEEDTAGADGTKVCPYCAEVIRAAAIKCRYCHSALNTSRGSPATADDVTAATKRQSRARGVGQFGGAATGQRGRLGRFIRKPSGILVILGVFAFSAGAWFWVEEVRERALMQELAPKADGIARALGCHLGDGEEPVDDPLTLGYIDGQALSVTIDCPGNEDFYEGGQLRVHKDAAARESATSSLTAGGGPHDYFFYADCLLPNPYDLQDHDWYIYGDDWELSTMDEDVARIFVRAGTQYCGPEIGS